MEPGKKLPEETLLEWYADQHPPIVDIVGDFAGQELFAIQGEALMRYCLVEAKVDFDGGFQLLHAIHAVEKILSGLKKRDCNFDVIFFQDMEDICVPNGVTGSNHASKYLLARRIIIQHLNRSDIDFKVLELGSFESGECKNYLASNAIHFMLCDEGRGDSREQTIRLRHLIWKILYSGRNVAVINSIIWESSKVFMPLLGGSKGNILNLRIDRPARNSKQPSDLSLAALEEISQHQLQGIRVVVKPDAIAKSEFLSSCGDLAKLCNDIAYMVFYSYTLVRLEALFAADGSKGEAPRQVSQHN
ncbi:hypothetical protein BHE90_015969 [Fusarium euwallaceae]|uniref:ATP-dependent RNA helicase DDX60 PIN-like domain-containing protein n=1 Tax=Fusarium euwallaceae TaxID=1147111 RepID=A0A430L1S0_9HYPO|nr:hypothetical protein BHE90_015969 [Fusarium euwallaceae]